MGFDARDWVRGLKPWEQFWNFCDLLANTEGTWLQVAQSRDDRNLGQWQKLAEEMAVGGRKFRPPAAGFDGLRAEIHGLRNDLREVHRLPTLPGPETPLDRIKDNKKAIAERRMDDALGYTG